MDEPSVQRFIDHAGDTSVAVAECIDGDATGKVEISLSVRVNQLDAFAAYQFHRRAFVGGEKR